MSTQIHPGCESFSAQGSRQGVLVLHGYGGSPESVMSVAKMCAGAGFTVECPRLPGHGTSIEDMLNYGFSDWEKTYTDALNDLKSRCDEVIIFGLSFGGFMTAYLAQRNPDVKAVVFVNPWIIPHDASLIELAKGAVDGGVLTMESMVTDPRVPNGIEFGYAETNIKGFVEISELIPTALDVSKIKVPALLFFHKFYIIVLSQYLHDWRYYHISILNKRGLAPYFVCSTTPTAKIGFFLKSLPYEKA